jgi:asparagine synthase (glutamine-hydrolysing)
MLHLRLTRQTWLRPPAHRAFAGARAAEVAARPARFDRFLDWEPRLRRACALEATVERLAADVDAVVVHPFHDRRFLAALARAGGWRGFGGRTSVMRELFTGDLPDDVLARQTKANFALTYFRGHARAFARRWDGRGFDPELVDAEALRRVWLNRIVDMRSALAIQHAWLDSVARGVEQPPADVVERLD